MTRRSMSFPAALVALVALAGCGADNTISSLATDSAPPSAPTNIREESRGAIAVLAWDASPDADVVGYDVYMYSPDPARESAYVRVNANTIAGEEFEVTTGASNNSWYRVKAVDQSGNRSSSSGAAFVNGIEPIGGDTPIDDLPILR
jgi:penicillin-binding protein